MKSKGFTLIELLVVIAIIGILSSVVLVSLQQARLKSQTTAYREYTKEVMKALELYKAENGSYPYEGVDDYTDYLLSDLIAGPLAPYLSSYTIPSGLQISGEIQYQSRISAGLANSRYSCNRPLDEYTQRAIEPYLLYVQSSITDLDLPKVYDDSAILDGVYCASLLAS